MIEMVIPGHDIFRFQFLKVELSSNNWRTFARSDNPVAAALLAKMGYTKKERKEVRLAYLRMILRLRNKLDPARLALIMSVADTYFEPDMAEDTALLEAFREQYPEEGGSLMELMPAWKRWGYEEGIEDGMKKGREDGMKKGREEERTQLIRKLLSKGYSPENVAETLEIPLEDVRKAIGASVS